MTATIGWLVLFLPLFAFLLLALPLRRTKQPAGYVSIAAVAGSFVLSVLLFSAQLGHAGTLTAEVPFLSVGQVSFPFSILIDPLTALMLVTVTGVSLLVQVFSLGYMRHLHEHDGQVEEELDPGFERYYAYLSLFTTAMLGLVLARNLVLIYVFWELVGLASFLLVGFWFGSSDAKYGETPADAAKKAFLTTRFGDFGFLLAILLLFSVSGTTDVPTLLTMAGDGRIAPGVLTLACLGIFAGAAGKSAQFPLHVWLPNAMAGPTPVSALIHAATMVAAGVYLVARTFPLFEASPTALLIVAWIGGITAFGAATIALVQKNLKGVLAYSTISQLGYMFMGLGTGELTAGMFHLFTHAFFKALLFLAAGAVLHATMTDDVPNDLDHLGGLFPKMRAVGVTFIIGALSLAGIFPLAGHWSKDEVLAGVLAHGNLPLYIVGQLTVFLTAFYVARMTVKVFFGPDRGIEPHPPGMSMTLPLVVLAVPSAIAGIWAVTGFPTYLESVPGVNDPLAYDLTTVLISQVLGIAGLGLGWAVYRYGPERAEALGAQFAPIYRILERRYYVDELYNAIIGVIFLSGGRALNLFDRYVVDGVVNGVGTVTTAAGEGLRRWEVGRVQFYGLFLFVGAFIVFVAFTALTFIR